MNELSAEYMKACDLDRRIKVSAQLAQQSLYEMCMNIKEMRDSRLYKELGYSEFNDYCKKELEFTDRQAYKFISIADNLSADLVNSSSLIGVTKLSLLAQLDEPTRTEIIESTDLESTTVRELKGKIKTLTEQAEEACERADRLEKSENKAWGEVSRFKTDSEMKSEKITQLEAEIKELESRPVEVAVSHEEENLRKAMQKIDLDWGIKYGELEEESNNERMKLLREHDAEIAALKEDYEKKLSERPAAETVTDDKETFKAYLAAAADAVKRLCAFITAHNDSPNAALYRSKAADLAKMITTVMED